MILLLCWSQHALLVPMTMARSCSQASNKRKIINPAGILNTGKKCFTGVIDSNPLYMHC
jgi:hypothetical protein